MFVRLGVLLCLAAPALAQQPPTPAAVESPRDDVLPDAVKGTWRITSNDRAEKIDGVVAEMPWHMRGFARSRLLEATRTCDQLQISEPRGHIAVRCDDRPLAIGAPGQRVPYTLEDGTQNTVMMDVAGGRLMQTFLADDGHRTTSYTVDGDRLRLDVTVESPRLPRPLTYTVSYAR